MPRYFLYLIPGENWPLRLLFSALCLLAPRANAEQRTTESIFVAFSYDAPPDCMGADPAFSLIERRSQRVVRTRSEVASQALHLKVVATPTGYQGVLTVRRQTEPPERRSMGGATCNEVVEALALTAALSIDPEASLSAANSRAGAPDAVKPAQDTAPPQKNEVVEKTRSTPAGSRKPAPAVAVLVGPAVIAERVMRHAVHAGAGLVLELSRPSATPFFPLEAQLGLHASVEARTTPDEGVVTRRAALWLAYCPVGYGANVSVHLCPLAEIGVVSASSRGFEQQTSVARLTAHVGAEGWLRAKLSPHARLWMAPAALVPLTERQFGVEPGPEILTRTSRLGWRLSSGVAWVF